MLTEAEKRAAQLAVSRYGADPREVEKVVQAVEEAKAHGEALDLLDALAVENLLPEDQVQELRASLDSTRIDPASPSSQQVLPAKETPAERPLAQTLVSKNGPQSNGVVPERAMPERAMPASTAMTEAEPRAVGSYRFLRKLGEGGMGSVHLAYEDGHDRLVAVKVLSSSLAINQTSVDRFYREARHGDLLNHPNIVRILGVAQDQVSGLHYLTMEYVDGPSAEKLLDHFGKLEIGDAVHVILDIARALEHAHSRNIVHRDIKPANILLTKSGLAKLADLGLAKRTDESSTLTATRQGFGTPYYMPYEQAIDAKKADARSDIFALGATLYHLVTGEVPFAGINPLEIADKKNLGIFTPASILNPDVPRALDKILSTMMARDPRERYQTVSELIVDLERAELAAAVPSFIDRDLAMQDPLVRQRVIAPAQATAPDLRPGSLLYRAKNGAAKEHADVWFLRYRDRQGQLCKAKVTAAQIRLRLGEGKISLAMEASKQPQGPFQPLGEFDEFVNEDETPLPHCRTQPSLARKPAEPPRPLPLAAEDKRVTGHWLWAGIAAAVGILGLLVFTLILALN